MLQTSFSPGALSSCQSHWDDHWEELHWSHWSHSPPSSLHGSFHWFHPCHSWGAPPLASAPPPFPVWPTWLSCPTWACWLGTPPPPFPGCPGFPSWAGTCPSWAVATPPPPFPGCPGFPSWAGTCPSSHHHPFLAVLAFLPGLAGLAHHQQPQQLLPGLAFPSWAGTCPSHTTTAFLDLLAWHTSSSHTTTGSCLGFLKPDFLARCRRFLNPPARTLDGISDPGAVGHPCSRGWIAILPTTNTTLGFLTLSFLRCEPLASLATTKTTLGFLTFLRCEPLASLATTKTTLGFLTLSFLRCEPLASLATTNTTLAPPLAVHGFDQAFQVVAEILTCKTSWKNLKAIQPNILEW